MLKDYSVGQEFREFLAVRKSNIATASNGSTFLNLTLGDGKQDLPAKMWDYRQEVKPEENTVIKVEAKMDEYQGSPQLILQRWRQAESGECDPGKFIPKTIFDIETMWRKLQNYINKIENPEIRKITDEIIDFHSASFPIYPASVYHHHAYIGGLLEHTIGVIDKALNMACVNCNKDLLIAGAALHDVGKIYDYKITGCSIQMTDEGKLFGHIISSAQIIQSYCSIKAIDIDVKNILLHMIASHHGKQEWGSPVEPVTKEAVILHNADWMDVQMHKISQAEEGVESGQWTERIRGINREFYKVGDCGAR